MRNPDGFVMSSVIQGLIICLDRFIFKESEKKRNTACLGAEKQRAVAFHCKPLMSSYILKES